MSERLERSMTMRAKPRAKPAHSGRPRSIAMRDFSWLRRHYGSSPPQTTGNEQIEGVACLNIIIRNAPTQNSMEDALLKTQPIGSGRGISPISVQFPDCWDTVIEHKRTRIFLAMIRGRVILNCSPEPSYNRCSNHCGIELLFC